MKIHLFCITYRVFFLNDRLARKPDIFDCFDKKVSDLGKLAHKMGCRSIAKHPTEMTVGSFESFSHKDSKYGRGLALAPLVQTQRPKTSTRGMAWSVTDRKGGPFRLLPIVYCMTRKCRSVRCRQWCPPTSWRG